MATATIPLAKEVIDAVIAEYGVPVGQASIREMNRIVNTIEERTGTKFIRMEFGIPGLSPSRIALDAEVRALTEMGAAGVYSPFDGQPVLKEAARDFAHAFLGLDLPVKCFIPTHGAMHGGFIGMGIAGYRFAERDTILFLDPGFPVNKLQCSVWGLRNESVDFHHLRGDALLAALEEKFRTGRVGGIMYSSPNNPTWVCFKDSELRGIGELCTKYGVIALEDLAYFGMDFREEYGIPYRPPYQPSVANHTDEYILLISSSKIFSYAGQRIAIAVVSPALFEKKFENLRARFGTDRLGHAFVHGGIYPTTAGVTASAQHGLAALLRAAVDGEIVFTEPVKEYARRAREMKVAFLANGFRLVYDNDLGQPLGDGFYFTVTYGDYDSEKLLEELIYYGISAIGLNTTGSTQEGIRACVSLTKLEQVPELRARLEAFHRDHR